MHGNSNIIILRALTTNYCHCKILCTCTLYINLMHLYSGGLEECKWLMRNAMLIYVISLLINVMVPVDTH